MFHKIKKLSPKRLYFKIVHQEGTPESMARAAAIGLAVGFVLPVGLQTIVVIPLAFIFKANKMLSFLFTMITNPYTAFLIYPPQCYLGSLVMMKPLKLADIEARLKTLTHDQSFDNMMSLGNDIIVPFFVGGAVLALLSAPIGYFACYGIVQRYRERREKHLLKRLSNSAKPKAKTLLNIKLPPE